MIKRSILLAAVISMLFSIVAFAAPQFVWEQDQYGWRFKNANTGNYIINGSVTQMNDGTYSTGSVASSIPIGARNNDIAASYFLKNGYMVTNAWMPYSEGNGKYSWRYYGADGKALSNTTTPDGYQVNELGFWVNNGVVVYDEAAKAELKKIQNDKTVIPPANQGNNVSLQSNSSGSIGQTAAAATSSGDTELAYQTLKYIYNVLKDPSSMQVTGIMCQDYTMTTGREGTQTYRMALVKYSATNSRNARISKLSCGYIYAGSLRVDMDARYSHDTLYHTIEDGTNQVIIPHEELVERVKADAVNVTVSNFFD